MAQRITYDLEALPPGVVPEVGDRIRAVVQRRHVLPGVPTAQALHIHAGLLADGIKDRFRGAGVELRQVAASGARESLWTYSLEAELEVVGISPEAEREILANPGLFWGLVILAVVVILASLAAGWTVRQFGYLDRDVALEFLDVPQTVAVAAALLGGFYLLSRVTK